jgi:excinuclease ABC subunit C
MEKFIYIKKDDLKNLPTNAGVYSFIAAKNETPLYIGKAINIRERVKNHFFQPTYKDRFFTDKTSYIGFIETASEIEALLLEANLIKKIQPTFNSVWRDDKNYFYVAVTKTEKPVVFITHQQNDQTLQYIGPFVEGTALKKTLKVLRRVFPYYTSVKHPKNKCTWCHLGLCPGPDPDLPQYHKNIKKLILILQGKRKAVLNSLKKEMRVLATQKKFEEASVIRDKMQALEQIMAHAKVIEDQKSAPLTSGWQKTDTILQGMLTIKTPVLKLECYDISNIQGTLAVGSMVVFVNGKPDKSQYKKFRIRMENKPNDIAMLKEVLSRRLQHPEWGYPEIMLIDGGIAQLNVGITTKNASRKTRHIKIISIAKGKRELFIEGRKDPIPLKKLPQEVYNLIVHLDDEAHRFAITYHKKLRSKALGMK